MIPVHQVLLVARREVAERLRDRAYRVSILLGLFMVTLFSTVPGLLSGDRVVWRLGAVGSTTADALARMPVPERTQVRVVVLADRATAERAVLDGDVQVAVVDGELVAEHAVDDAVRTAVQAALRERAMVADLTALGAPAAAVERALHTPDPPVRFLDPRDPERERRARWAGIGAVVLFGQMFGNVIWVATAVTEEKASRVVELLLAKIRPRWLLMGKVLGLGALGLAQTLLTVGLGLLGSRLGGSSLPEAVLVDALGLLGWFVLGYVLFAAVFAMAGSLVARQEDLQSVTLPASLVMALSMAGVFPALADPAGPLARVLSFVPLTAPMTMPMRVAMGVAAWWEVLVAAAGVVATCALLVRLAGKVYAGAALRTSGRITVREALAAADR